MMTRLAWRNIWRNRGRTAILVSAVALSLGMMLVTYGLTEDRREKMMSAAVRTSGGNILVHGNGYWDAQTGDILIPDGDGTIAVVSAVEGVNGVVPRVLIGGLLTSTHGAEGVQLRAVVPDLEAAVYDFRPALIAGTFLGDEVDDPLVLGAGLVESLDLELGDRVVLTATAPDGEVTRALFHLSGIVRTGASMIDDSLGFTTISAARSAMGMDAQLTQLGLLLDDDSQRATVATAVRNALDSASLADLEVLTWDEAIPDLLGFIRLDDRFAAIYGFVIFVVVAFGIANTLMMMVMERVRELGMLNAIGLSPRRIRSLVLLETGMLTLVSVVIGVGLGLLGHFALVRWGLDVTKLAGDVDLDVAGVSLNDVIIRSQLVPLRWATGTLLVVFLIFLSSLYPAWRASRLDPVAAMRTYQ